MKVFKFGGASVKNADGFRNLARVVQNYKADDLIIVVSAMGKTTNALERLLDNWTNKANWSSNFEELKKEHLAVLKEVAPKDNGEDLRVTMGALEEWLRKTTPGDYDRDYDQVVSYGELWSTYIVNAHLNEVGLSSQWLDAREVVCTNDTFRTARVKWDASQERFDQKISFKESQRYVTQGFIGAHDSGYTTTLGREGSDFSAAIFAYLGGGESVTIWKDVEGMFNADPRKFEDTVLLTNISYREAIELSYFGASVIHPRTVKPLQNKEIPLHVRSFLDLDKPGSLISFSTERDDWVPSFITNPDRVLLSIIPRDLSFIVEEHMAEIFGIFAQHRVKIDLTQNSALAFSAVVADTNKLETLIAALEGSYEVRYNKGLELLTVRHYDEETLERLTGDRDVLIEQRSRSTARFVLG